MNINRNVGYNCKNISIVANKLHMRVQDEVVSLPRFLLGKMNRYIVQTWRIKSPLLYHHCKTYIGQRW
ncbi:hypothetical protein CY34DRAFT_111815 [Suillus luteus UH-Slu-Lm8-n1]|uniref:Uncharacterized protein n=1 Tax=Suillus luteus UH-Slu-Lm8-n1 TaxID=930992 RepID=A0A0D0BIN7_9AGAM|nr:hypothetical protein CY34DRAFT_111815 [Suillus luteus UH-Slu-Lm8-n1]